MQFPCNKYNFASTGPMLRLNKFGQLLMLAAIAASLTSFTTTVLASPPGRERLSFDSDWRFIKGDPEGISNELSYANIKAWVLPSGNAFVKDGTNSARPDGDLGADVPYTKRYFDDG